MSHVFEYRTTVRPDWIDYNGHMQDAYYGLIFSYAVDGVQDEVGFDAAYRAATGCTIYLLEDHKYFLREVGEGAEVRVEARVLDCDAKRFHLHLQMFEGDDLVAVAEAMECHVRQTPQPHAVAMPDDIRAKLEAARIGADEAAALRFRARAIGF